MKVFPTAVALAWSLMSLLPRASAGETFSSGAGRVALIELYTSEGCSSCPPADQWLGALKNDPALWRDFVPVEFHVSYWDALGWRDLYAAKKFTDRQYAYAKTWSSGSVYTPCFVRDGEEWRPSKTLGHGEDKKDSPGVLSVVWRGSGRCDITFTPPKNAPGDFEVQVALLGSGLRSAVKAGENAGRNLPHDFVVLGLAGGPLARQTDQSLSATLTLDAKPAGRLALAVWVTRRGELAALQATGGWLGAQETLTMAATLP